MSKVKKSRKQESSEDSDDSSTSQESSSDSSSDDRTRKQKKKSRKVKKGKLKYKSIEKDDLGSKNDLRPSKRSKKSEKRKKKRKHEDSDSERMKDNGKVLFISSGAECEDDRQKHWLRNKRLSELKMLRVSDVHGSEKNFRSKWDSPAEEREKMRSGNYFPTKYGKDDSRDEETNSSFHPDRYNRRPDNENFECRRNSRNEDEGKYREDIAGMYEFDYGRYDREYDIRRSDYTNVRTARDYEADNNRGPARHRNNPNRSFNDRRQFYGSEIQQRGDNRRRHIEGREGGEYDQLRNFDDRRRNDRMETDGPGRKEMPGRISRNPFDRKVVGVQGEESRRDEPRREEPRRDEPRRDEPRREEPRRDEPRREEPRRDEHRRDGRGWANDNRYSDRYSDRITLKRERENSGGNRFEDSRRYKKLRGDYKSFEKDSRNISEIQRNDKKDGRGDYERDAFQDRNDSRERRRPRTLSTTPVQRNRRYRRGSNDDTGQHEWGKKPSNSNDNSKHKSQPIEKEKPNFGLSGKLTEDTNKVNGVVINYAEPAEARKPKRRWRLYPFKGEQSLQTFYIHRQSCFLIGRERKICDIPVDHPSCSKQHAVLQYRLVPYEKEDGSTSKRVRPYLLDMNSANGTFVNNKKIESKKYLELMEKDVIKFGFSSREYVLLHENSKDDNLDDDIGNDDIHIKVETGD